MIASKEGGIGKPQPEEERSECCMCGDHGLSIELFRCKLCHFRSQHRYCSNQYPKAELYRVCNWCLSQDDHDSVQNSSNSSSSCRNSGEGDQSSTVKNKKSGITRRNDNQGGGLMMIKDNRVNLRIHLKSSPIKKHKLDEGSPASATRKRITTGGGGGGVAVDESVVRKSKVEESSNGGGGITKQVYRNKSSTVWILDFQLKKPMAMVRGKLLNRKKAETCRSVLVPVLDMDPTSLSQITRQNRRRSSSPTSRDPSNQSIYLSSKL